MTQQEAFRQCLRLDCLSAGKPAKPEGMAEVVNALFYAAKSAAHAKAIISAYLESPLLDGYGNARWPTPDKIRAIAWALSPKETVPYCEECNHTGWRIVERAVYSCGMPQTLSFAEQCSCYAAAADKQSG